MNIQDLPIKGAYAQAWRNLRALPDGALVSTDWTGSRPASIVKREFRTALMHRINSRGGLEAANVPMDLDLVRDARALDDRLQRRIRVYQFQTALMRKRFSHHLSNHND